jgi:plastocyanin
MHRIPITIPVLLAAAVLCGCGDDSGSITNSITNNASVSIEDRCDSASFNAGLGAGTCTRAGGTSLAQFNSQLAAQQFVNGWDFNPNALTIRMGQSISAMNNGGEKHSFTQVRQFGGGIIPALNTASGNPVEAPECAQLATNALIPPGGTFTTDPATTTGTELYQCCIHPWMRATVTVTG